MRFVPMSELLTRAVAGGYAVPAFCAWNAEAMINVLSMASDLRAPVIIMNGPAEFGLISPPDFGAMAYALAAQFDVPAALHLDHGDSLVQVETCLSSGYTSVMLDFSSRSYAENAGALRQVAAMARPRGVTVEGEIGHVGKVDAVSTEGAGISTLTEPEEAATYVAETGVNALAISIGNAHGQYTRLPSLDFDRLAAIRKAVDIPLVLHGGSGTPESDLKRVISLGIAKVNVATELIAAVRESLLEQWGKGENEWTPVAQTMAMRAMAPIVEKWIRRTGADGQA